MEESSHFNNTSPFIFSLEQLEKEQNQRRNRNAENILKSNFYFDSKLPIIIDNGSYHCRAGFPTFSEPLLNFRSLVGKPRAASRSSEFNGLYVGNDIQQDSRLLIRTPFEQNIVFHFDAQEMIFDYVFSKLKIESERINHPIVITEAVCNPKYCRKNMSELLFECYGVPAVSYGIDSIFSLYGVSNIPVSNGLIVSSGFNCTHIIPFLSNRVYLSRCKRISIGGNHLTEYMQKLLQLKCPKHRSIFSYEISEILKENHTYVATNYIEELNFFKKSDNLLDSNTHSDNKIQILQLPVPIGPPPLTEEEKERKQQIKLEAAARLKRISEKKKQEREAIKQKKIEELEYLLSLRETDPVAFQNKLKESEFETEEEVQKALIKLTGKKPKLEEQSENPLLSIPDDQLTAEQKKEKKKLIKLKNAKEGREKAHKKRKEQKKESNDELSSIMKNNETLEQYIASLKQRKEEILQKKEKRKILDSQATGGRNTFAKQKKRKALAEVISAENLNEEEDRFGENDEDWALYLEIVGANPNNEEEEEELREIEHLLNKIDPEAEKKKQQLNNPSNLEVEYQVTLSTERIRIPEVLFQPSIIGINQMGISEAIYHVLNQFPNDQREILTKYVYLTGGSCLFPNMNQRIYSEIQKIQPSQSIIKVFHSQSSTDAWKGAAKWAMDHLNNLETVYLTRAVYEEKGGDYLLEHYASNIYY